MLALYRKKNQHPFHNEVTNMRLMKLLELCQQPPGTVFSQWVPACATGLYVFHSACSHHDFFYIDLLPSPDTDKGNYDAPICDIDTLCRWGIFDDDETFAVFERAEVEALTTLLHNGMNGNVTAI